MMKEKKMLKVIIKKGRTVFFLCFVILAIFVKTAALAQGPDMSNADIGTALQDFSRLSANDKNLILSATGLPQPGNLEIGKIIASIIFSAIGFIAFMYGKKNSFFRPMVIGIALMVYSYFIPGMLMNYLVGVALTAALYFWRE